MATATTSAANPQPPPLLTVTAQDRLLAACPCLNVKLHLATAPEENSSLAGMELKLGLAGVFVVRHNFLDQLAFSHSVLFPTLFLRVDMSTRLIRERERVLHYQYGQCLTSLFLYPSLLFLGAKNPLQSLHIQ